MSFRGFVLFCLSSLLLFSTIVAGVGISSFVFLEAGTYTPYIEKSGIYEQVGEMLPDFSENSTISLENSAKAVVDLMFSRVFAYINGETNELNLTITIDSPEIRQTIKNEVNNLPTCDSAIDPIKDKVLCKPTGANVDEIVEQWMNSQELSEIKTESIDLGEFIGTQGLSQVRDSILVYRKAVYIAIGFSLILAGLILLIGWSTKRRGLTNLGIPLISAGAGIFALFYIGVGSIEKLIAEKVPALSTFSFVDAVMDVVETVSGRFIFTSLILIIIGICCIVLGFVFKREEESEKNNKRD